MNEIKEQHTKVIDINSFYINRIVDEDFDEISYQKKYPDTEKFYQPYCSENGISDKQRLFYHYVFYGAKEKKFENIHFSQDIKSFYLENTVPSDFDEIWYQVAYPETLNFCKKYCAKYDIDDKHRLFYHYFFYGRQHGHFVNRIDQLRSYNINITNLDDLHTMNVDAIIPPHEKYTSIYNHHVELGKNIIKNKKVAVVGLARDCGDKIQKSIDNIKNLDCEELKIFIFENDSTDNTKDILKSLSSLHDNIFFKSVDNNSPYLTGLSSERTKALSEYRNYCLNWVKENCIEYDYTIVLDLDADIGFSINGIYNSVSWLDSTPNAGGMSSYSLLLNVTHQSVNLFHYDTFAIRLNDWEPTNDRDKNNGFRFILPIIGSEPFHLYSCFGGLSIYKTEAFVKGIYSHELGCEHVGFHKSLHDKGYKMYLNPSSRFFGVYKNIHNI